MDEAADSGVATMIIFIAMVLAAGTAASIMISVAQDLQQQAQDTAEQALTGISNGLEVVTVSGDRNEDGYDGSTTSSTIQVLSVTIRPQAGSNAIDLDNLVIYLSEGTRAAELILNTTGTNASHADGLHFSYTTIRDSDSSLSDGNVINYGDLVKLYLSCDSSATNLALEPNVQVTMRLVPLAGMLTQELFTTPASYTNRIIELV